MIKNVNFNAADSVASLGAYASPEVSVLSVESEGLLCASVINGHEGFWFVGEDEEL